MTKTTETIYNKLQEAKNDALEVKIESKTTSEEKSTATNTASKHKRSSSDSCLDKVEAKIKACKDFRWLSIWIPALVLVLYFIKHDSNKLQALEDDYPNCRFDQFCEEMNLQNFTAFAANCTNDSIDTWCDTDSEKNHLAQVFYIIISGFSLCFAGIWLANRIFPPKRTQDDLELALQSSRTDEEKTIYEPKVFKKNNGSATGRSVQAIEMEEKKLQP